MIFDYFDNCKKAQSWSINTDAYIGF